MAGRLCDVSAPAATSRPVHQQEFSGLFATPPSRNLLAYTHRGNTERSDNKVTSGPKLSGQGDCIPISVVLRREPKDKQAHRSVRRCPPCGRRWPCWTAGRARRSGSRPPSPPLSARPPRWGPPGGCQSRAPPLLPAQLLVPPLPPERFCSVRRALSKLYSTTF